MGGVGALLYDTTYPGEVTGVLVLAPYLGRETLVQKIRTAGGVERWQSSREMYDKADSDSEAQFTALIWSRLNGYEDRKRTIGRVYLGFGNQDRFNTIDSIFGDMLPAGQVFTAKGGHDWSTWNLLGERMINAVSVSNGWTRSLPP